MEYAKFQYDKWQEIWRDARPEAYRDEDIRRQLTFLKELGTSALTEAELTDLTRTVGHMSTIYGGATVCPFENQNCNKTSDKVYTLDPEIVGKFAHSRNADELKYLWKQWRDESGKKIRSSYQKYVDLLNTAARANNYPDASKWWQSRFEDRNFVENIDRLWDQVSPLYNELHTYMRYKLIEIYGE